MRNARPHATWASPAPLVTEPSLALGTSGVTLLEMTAAYAAVAANGYPVRAEGLPPDEEDGWFSRLWNRNSLKRDSNLDELRGWHLQPAQMTLTGIHPRFGTVTLEQLLAREK